MIKTDSSPAFMKDNELLKSLLIANKENKLITKYYTIARTIYAWFYIPSVGTSKFYPSPPKSREAIRLKIREFIASHDKKALQAQIKREKKDPNRELKRRGKASLRATYNGEILLHLVGSQPINKTHKKEYKLPKIWNTFIYSMLFIVTAQNKKGFSMKELTDPDIRSNPQASLYWQKQRKGERNVQEDLRTYTPILPLVFGVMYYLVTTQTKATPKSLQTIRDTFEITWDDVKNGLKPIMEYTLWYEDQITQLQQMPRHKALRERLKHHGYVVFTPFDNETPSAILSLLNDESIINNIKQMLGLIEPLKTP